MATVNRTRPTATEASDIRAQRGTGQLESVNSYLKNTDPTSYFYKKFKSENNEFLRDDFWSEAATRGESQDMASLLEASKDKGFSREAVDIVSGYEGRADYDSYMLALQTPHLDNTTKKERLGDNDYSFGEYTDQEWATEILKRTTARWDAEIVQADKDRRNWFTKTGAQVVSQVGNFTGAILNFTGDVYNLEEGLFNMLFNWSGDANAGDRFLHAFDNDDKFSGNPWAKVGDWLTKATFEFQKNYANGVDAVDAFDEGYRLGDGPNWIAQIANSSGEGTGTNWWGTVSNGISQAIGYMVPTIALAYFTGGASTTGTAISAGARSALFYSGIFSGMVKDSVTTASLNGVSYKDLNAGKVVAQAGLKAAAQYAVEKGLGMLIGFTAIDRGIGTAGSDIASEAATKAAASLATKTGWRAGAAVAARFTKEALKEGLEETFQELSDSFIDEAFDGRFGVDVTIQELVDAFVIGALTSYTMGLAGNVKTFLPGTIKTNKKTGEVVSNRGVTIDKKGKTAFMGAFQTMNLNESMRLMNDHMGVINDNKSSIEKKAKSMFSMNAAMAILGDVYATMGTERSAKADAMVSKMVASNNKKTQLKALNTNTKYSNELWQNLYKVQSGANIAHVKTLEKKVKDAIKKRSKLLKSKQVTKLDNIVTTTTKLDETNSDLEADTYAVLQEMLTKTDIKVLVGVDGATVASSDDVAFVNNKLIKSGDIPTIIKGLAYDKSVKAVEANLTPRQSKLVLHSYNKITGTNGTINQAITALLFDKQFYGYMLLKTSEAKYKTSGDKAAAINILMKIDQLITGKLSPYVAAGTVGLDQKAYMTLLKKVQENMRSGLVTFATQYAFVDVGAIDNAILPKELKDAINAHRNVIFTKLINKITSDKSNKVPNAERIAMFDKELDKHKSDSDLTSQKIKALKENARSTDYLRRLDAGISLNFYAKRSGSYKEKTTFLETDPFNASALNAIAHVENVFGVGFDDLINGTFSPLDINPEINKSVYALDNYQDRLAAIREVLFNSSAKAYTLGYDGKLLEVLDKDTFIQDKYLGDQQKFKNDFKAKQKAGKDFTLQDISKIDLAADTKTKFLSETKVIIKPGALKAGTNNHYDEDTNTIILRGTDINNVVMHEVTHATQFSLMGYDNDSVVYGGAPAMFDILPDDVQADLTDYIKTNLPLSYELLKDPDGKNYYFAYFMLAGEIEANSSLTAFMFETGFRWKDDRQTLVSPNDNNRTWPMAPDATKEAARDKGNLQKKAKQYQKAQDTPLVREKQKALKNKKSVQTFMKDGFLQTKSGVPLVMYRGAGQEGAQQHEGHIFLTSSPQIASAYAGGTSASTNSYVGWISNLQKDDVYVIDGKGKSFDDLRFKGMALSTDNAVKWVQENTTKKAVLIKNVVEADYIETKPAHDLIIFDTAYDTMKRVTMEDNGKFIKNWTDKLNRNDFEQYNGRRVDSEQFYNYVTALSTSATNVAEDAAIPTTGRYINNKVASTSNLKYRIRKGIQIQVNDNVANFIVATTKDFAKLPKVLKDSIKSGKTTYYDISKYVATTKSMNDYTFKAIAKYFYNNEQLAKTTYSAMRSLLSNIEELSTLSYMVPAEYQHKQITPANMTKLLIKTLSDADTDTTIAKSYTKYMKRSQTVMIKTDAGKVAFIDNQHADAKQLNTAVFLHYDGTLRGMRSINAIGKYMSFKQNDIYNKDTNWVQGIRTATTDYEQDIDISEMLDTVTRQEKLNTINNYVANALIAKVEKLPIAERKVKGPKVMAELRRIMSKMAGYDETTINKRYLAALSNENAKTQPIENIVKPLSEQPRSTKNLKDHIRERASRVTERIGGLKRRYNKMPDSIKAVIDPKTYKLTKTYQSMSDQDLLSLLVDMKETAKQLSSIIGEQELRQQKVRIEKARLDRVAKRETTTKTDKRSLREKLKYVHTTKVINQTFEFESRDAITKSATEMLNTQWGKQRMSTVKGVSNNRQQNVHNGEVFFKNNANTLMDMTTAEAEATAKWFMDANMTGIAGDSTETQTFAAVKMYFLGYVLSEIKDGGQFYKFNANVKSRINNNLKGQVTAAGTALSVWKNLKTFINPIEAMKAADMEIAGVLLTADEKNILLDAAKKGNMEDIAKAQATIINRVNQEKTSKKGILRKITMLRSMSMLTGPPTWLRNKISNFMLKRLNKISSKIGDKVFTEKSVAGQFKMNGKVTTEIQDYIDKHFIDNKLFDTIVSNLSKYNPSDIQRRFKDATGVANKDALFANMVIKSMYNQYYNQSMFDNKIVNKYHQFLMKVLSDNNYVREAAIRYFGKIMAERGYSLQGDVVSDDIMSDFATAIGMGMKDYMHSDNKFNEFETMLAGVNEELLFAYKLILPFGAAQWNWFKAAVTYSPLGLMNSIRRLTKLEAQITKAETKWAEGTAQVPPEMTEYLIRRDVGSGVIGTMAVLFGMLLAATGKIALDDDDYGTPKLRIGSVDFDVATIFGSSSVLAGAALIKGWGENGKLVEGLDAMAGPLLDGFFLTQILELDQYNNGGWVSWGIGYGEQTMLSFIPNGLRWLSGASATGSFKPDNVFERAVARLPFLGSAFGVNKKVNPYTGDEGDLWDAFNRIVPFVEVRNISSLEEKSRALGINKDQLRGKYTINGEAFDLTATQTAELNRQYGNWNAIALTEFYNSSSMHRVLTEHDTFATLRYSQMTEEQRARTVGSIMTKNSTYAKIQAWLKDGNKYYASDSEYATLKKLGITGLLYNGSQGFVAK